MSGSGETSGAAWKRWLNRLGPTLALIVIFLLFCAIAPPSFSTSGNIETILRQTTIVGIGALGMTLVIIAGGIDLSVGSVVAMTTVVVAWTLKRNEASGAAWVSPLAALAGVGCAGACGWFTGMVVTRLRVAPFIATLGMLLVVRGLAKWFADNKPIYPPSSAIDNLMRSSKGVLLPNGVWVMFALAVMTWALLKYSKLGRHIIAVGSNEQTARLCGLPVSRVKVIVYSLCGLLCGVAGVMQFSRLTVGDPTVAQGLELDMVAAVVIGGGSLAGGEGSVVGTLVGALILAVIRSGCSQMEWPNWVQEVVTGVIIVTAVWLDRLRHRRAA